MTDEHRPVTAEDLLVTYDDLVSRKKPVTKTVTIVLDPVLADEYEDAKRERDVASARAGARPADSDVQARLWEAEETLARLEARLEEERALVRFTFRAIGRAAYDALASLHPPTPAQRAHGKATGQETVVNEETFPPALVAASLVEPKLSPAEAQALWADDAWNSAELLALFAAAAGVNGTRRTVELGKGSRRTQPSAQS
jgi:hypothetical protein